LRAAAGRLGGDIDEAYPGATMSRRRHDDGRVVPS